MSSSTQYNSIGSRYNRLKALPFITIEIANLHHILSPLLARFPNARVLDLACGTGNVTRAVVDWGAASSLGVDISQAMIDGARQLNDTQERRERVKYVVADATKMDVLGWNGEVVKAVGEDDGQAQPQFDIVVASWLLNYAEDEEDMAQMWNSITRNLKPGGVFVGVTHPLPDIDGWVGRIARVNKEHPGVLGVRLDVEPRIGTGVGYWMMFHVLEAEDGEGFAFGAFIMPQSLYEEGARAAGMSGKFKVEDFVMPDEVKSRESVEYWKVYEKYAPHFSVFTMQK